MSDQLSVVFEVSWARFFVGRLHRYLLLVFPSHYRSALKYPTISAVTCFSAQFTIGAVCRVNVILNSVALVRTRTIPTERPPPVGEVTANFCG